MTCALRYARAAPALAMSYISIVLTIIYGYYIFTEVRDLHSYQSPLPQTLASLLRLGNAEIDLWLHHHVTKQNWDSFMVMGQVSFVAAGTKTVVPHTSSIALSTIYMFWRA